MTEISFSHNIFDLIRYYAMFQVMIFHMISHFKIETPAFVNNVILGFPGVVILFAMSGYLSAASLDRDSNIGDYLKKRFFRIFPEFWLCILVNTAVIAVLYKVVPTFFEKVVYLVTQFFLLNFYTGGWLRGYGVGAPNGSLWTVLVEVEFYLILLISYKFLKKMGRLSSLIVFLILLIPNYLLGIMFKNPTLIYKLLLTSVIPYLYMFFTGVFLYRFRNEILGNKKINILLTIASLVVYFTYGELVTGVYIPLIKGISLSILTINLAYVTGKKIRVRLDITYGVYLYHMVFVNMLLMLGCGGAKNLLIATILSLILGYLSTLFGRYVRRRWMIL